MPCGNLEFSNICCSVTKYTVWVHKSSKHAALVIRTTRCRIVKDAEGVDTLSLVSNRAPCKGWKLRVSSDGCFAETEHSLHSRRSETMDPCTSSWALSSPQTAH